MRKLTGACLILTAPVFAFAAATEPSRPAPPAETSAPLPYALRTRPSAPFDRGYGGYDWKAGLVFFSDASGPLPALELWRGGAGADKGVLLYASGIPDPDDDYAFLRGLGVPVKRVYTTVYNKVADASSTYTTDQINRFDRLTVMLVPSVSAPFKEGRNFRLGALLGLPLARVAYDLDAGLDDGSRLRENGEAFGAGIAPGLYAGVAPGAVPGAGLTLDFYLTYTRLWFFAGGRRARDIGRELDELRFGFAAGWRFRTYR
ncbi:MAG TPA: hypothetical protein PK523_11730 [Elusimicrobiales bacterium]|nr:hypothetical protein [Elusimicrobiales bacterium]